MRQVFHYYDHEFKVHLGSVYESILMVDSGKGTVCWINIGYDGGANFCGNSQAMRDILPLRLYKYLMVWGQHFMVVFALLWTMYSHKLYFVIEVVHAQHCKHFTFSWQKNWVCIISKCLWVWTVLATWACVGFFNRIFLCSNYSNSCDGIPARLIWIYTFYRLKRDLGSSL